MKRKDIDVFQLTHTYLKEDEEVYIKTDMSEKQLLKLIKTLQAKTYDIEETYDLSPTEMRDVLLQYEGIRAFPNEDDLLEMNKKNGDGFDFIELDLYLIWEAKNIEVSEEEIYSDYYKNDTALKMINNYISEELALRG